MSDNSNTENNRILLCSSLPSTSLREAFITWLSADAAKEYPTTVLISSFDKISAYAIRKKISTVDLWSINQHSTFRVLYNRLLEMKFLRIMERNAYKVFIVAGRLYLQFLKKKHSITNISKKESDASVQLTASNKYETKSTELTEEIATKKSKVLKASQQQFKINPEDVIAWLVTQPNTNGTLYLENVARQYMYALRSAPSKLQLLEAENIDVFACRTVSELNILWDTFKTTSNYKQVNTSTSGALSAGMGCLSRYLADFSKEVTKQSSQLYKARSNEMVSSISMQDTNDLIVVEKLTGILTSRFSNGYRLNSPIEMARFRLFAMEDLNEEILLSDEDVKNYIMASGITYNGKVYAITTHTKEHIKELAEEYFSRGAQVIFFTEFYAKNEHWLFGASIVSGDMLIDILRGLFPNLSFTQTYFGYTDVSVLSAIEREILRVWGDDVLLTYNQLSERLQYIPIDRIKSALARNSDFIWNSIGTFSHVNLIGIIDKERKAIQEAAERGCSTCGYISVADLPLVEIEERNHDLSVTAVHSAVYHVCLSDKFDKNGKIVTRKGDTFDALSIIKEHCRTIDKCSLDDLLNFGRDLTGEIHRWIPMEAGNTILVRIDKDAYVADKYIHFNIEAIDAAIEIFIEKDYLPLKSFTTFGTFPDCGHTWNLFLLESYCRRFSKEFRFDTPSVNSRNTGIIIRKSCNLTYTEIMADAVANSDILLNDSGVGRFLCDNGYTSRGTTAKASEIINKAKAIREGLNDERN